MGDLIHLFDVSFTLPRGSLPTDLDSLFLVIYTVGFVVVFGIGFLGGNRR